MTIRFGVIGLRRGASFVRVCQAAQGATVSALFDIDAAAVGIAAAEIGGQPFSNYEDFLNSDIDAVVVASPLPFHAEQAAQALQADKQVLSEVTACLDMDQAWTLVEAAEESNAIYMMAENYHYLDEIELLRRLALDNCSGNIYFLESEYLHDCKDLWHDAEASFSFLDSKRSRRLLPGAAC